MRKYNISNIKAYLVGNLRLRCYDNAWSMFMRKHILEQIAWRIEVMDPACYNNGACGLCGCETPALQMSDKGCDKPCYPNMMNRERWKAFQQGWTCFDQQQQMQWQIRNRKLISNKVEDYVG